MCKKFYTLLNLFGFCAGLSYRIVITFYCGVTLALKTCLFALAVFVGISLSAEACSPPGDQYTLLERFERSDVVFQGQVFAVEEISCPPGPEFLPQTNDICGRRLRILVLNRVIGDVPDILEFEEPFNHCSNPNAIRGHRTFFFFKRGAGGELSSFMPWWSEDSALDLIDMSLEEFRRRTIDRHPLYMPNGDLIMTNEE